MSILKKLAMVLVLVSGFVFAGCEDNDDCDQAEVVVVTPTSDSDSRQDEKTPAPTPAPVPETPTDDGGGTPAAANTIAMHSSSSVLVEYSYNGGLWTSITSGGSATLTKPATGSTELVFHTGLGYDASFTFEAEGNDVLNFYDSATAGIEGHKN